MPTELGVFKSRLGGMLPTVARFHRDICTNSGSGVHLFFCGDGVKIEDYPAASCGECARYCGSSRPLHGQWVTPAGRYSAGAWLHVKNLTCQTDSFLTYRMWGRTSRFPGNFCRACAGNLILCTTAGKSALLKPRCAHDWI
jgi:hypothetical protein